MADEIPAMTDREKWERYHPNEPFREKREGHWWSSISDTKKALIALVAIGVTAFMTGTVVAAALATFQGLPAKVAELENRVTHLEVVEVERRSTDQSKLTMLAFLACREDQRLRPETQCPAPPRWWEVLSQP